MLTLEQLRDTKVDFDIATEALAQSEKRLDDAFDDYGDSAPNSLIKCTGLHPVSETR